MTSNDSAKHKAIYDVIRKAKLSEVVDENVGPFRFFLFGTYNVGLHPTETFKKVGIEGDLACSVMWVIEDVLRAHNPDFHLDNEILHLASRLTPREHRVLAKAKPGADSWWRVQIGETYRFILFVDPLLSYQKEEAVRLVERINSVVPSHVSFDTSIYSTPFALRVGLHMNNTHALSLDPVFRAGDHCEIKYSDLSNMYGNCKKRPTGFDAAMQITSKWKNNGLTPIMEFQGEWIASRLFKEKTGEWSRPKSSLLPLDGKDRKKRRHRKKKSSPPSSKTVDNEKSSPFIENVEDSHPSFSDDETSEIPTTIPQSSSNEASSEGSAINSQSSSNEASSEESAINSQSSSDDETSEESMANSESTSDDETSEELTANSESSSAEETSEDPAIAHVVPDLDRLLCVVCIDREKAVVFLPCRHMVCCSTCAEHCPDCPVCREHVNGYFAIFIS